jgi:pimeloyl-ACP methyl ester carboxylesterase
MSSPEIDAFFKKNIVEASQHSYKVGFRELHYVKAGDDTKPLVLFLHGSPGSLSAFIDFLTDSALLEHGLLITADRPGFGYSNFGNGEPSLQKQCAFLKPILQEYKSNRPVVLVGHSLAGALIVRMAMEYPDLVDGLIIVAGSVDPELEPAETWFRAPLATPFLSWILPNSFRASNEEIYQLKPELQKMLPLWKNVTCPVIVIQGKKDDLVSPGNADFAKKMLINAPVDLVLVDDMNHFVPWSHPYLIHKAILTMLQKLTSNAPDLSAH